jgi:hypothetical protein
MGKALDEMGGNTCINDICGSNIRAVESAGMGESGVEGTCICEICKEERTNLL